MAGRIKTEIEWQPQAFPTILNSPRITAVERAEATRLVAALEAVAAGTPFIKSTGAYQSSFRIIEHKGTDRTTVHVVNDQPYAAKLERKYGIMARGLATAGLG